MLITVEELRQHPVDFDLTWPAGGLSLESAAAATVGAARIQGRAQLAGAGMRITGRVQATTEPLCARCAEPVPTEVDRTFDLLYQPESLIAEAGEVEIHTPDTELGFFVGTGVALDDVAREQLELALPMQTFCRPDCHGLCARCGANLNLGPCGCAPPVDDRWRALEELRRRK